MADAFTGYQNALPQTSLADMMNLASSAQQYKQAQALNPLQLQQAQVTLEQLQRMNPELFKEAQARAAQAVTESGVSSQTAAPRVATALLQPGIAQAQLGKAQTDLATSQLENVSAQYRAGARKALDLIDKPNLKYQDVVGELTAFMKRNNASDDAIAQAVASVPNTTDQKTLKAAVSDFALKSLTSEQEMNKRFPAATATTTEAGKTFITQPAAFPKTMPKVTQGVAGGGQGMPQPEQGAPQPIGQAAPQGLQPAQMGVVGISAPIKSTYPIRVGQGAGTYTPAVGEEEDRATGLKMRQALTANLNTSAQMNRNLEESLKSITKLDPGAFYSSGYAGTIRRNLANFFGSSDYKELSKNLANLEIAQLQAQGQSLQTDSGKHLLAKASGDETYNPDVLMDIVQRTAATQKELQLKAPAIQTFTQRFGDANYAKFNQEWSNNADSKVFQVMNIIDRVKDPKEQKAQIDALLGADKAKRKEYLEKYDNIQKLVKNGSLD
jgi:hypothetical protein